MSFLSGIMMGASLGSTIHDALTGSTIHDALTGSSRKMTREACRGALPEFALVSSLQGRRRYRLAALAANPALCRYLEERLGSLSDIRSVRANEVTGSLLLEYTASEETIDRLMEGIRQRLVPVSGRAQAAAVPGQAAGQVAAPLHGQGYVPTLYAKSWSGTGNFLNSQVRRLTGNSFDISALISLFFLIRGIRKMLVYGQRPSGPSMIWWALHLMKGWRK